jgi:hypothetical protein
VGATAPKEFKVREPRPSTTFQRQKDLSPNILPRATTRVAPRALAPPAINPRTRS